MRHLRALTFAVIGAVLGGLAGWYPLAWVLFHVISYHAATQGHGFGDLVAFGINFGFQMGLSYGIGGTIGVAAGIWGGLALACRFRKAPTTPSTAGPLPSQP